VELPSCHPRVASISLLESCAVEVKHSSIISTEGENGDVSTHPKEGDGDAACCYKGKGVAGASSSGTIARRTTNVEAGVEVVARNGKSAICCIL
jgi:hypothetical protein